MDEITSFKHHRDIEERCVCIVRGLGVADPDCTDCRGMGFVRLSEEPEDV